MILNPSFKEVYEHFFGTFVVPAQKHGSMFRALDSPDKGVFSTTRTCAECYSERQFSFCDRPL